SARKVFSAFEAWRAIVEGQRDFFVPRGIAPWLGGKQGVVQSSFYDTSQLKSTLERFVDFDRINEGTMRVLVGTVNVRIGNIQYSSRTRAVTDFMGDAQRFRHMLREVLEHVPPKVRDADPWCRKAQEFACERQYSVIHLIYQDKEWESLSKDYEFSPQSMQEH